MERRKRSGKGGAARERLSAHLLKGLEMSIVHPLLLLLLLLLLLPLLLLPLLMKRTHANVWLGVQFSARRCALVR